MRFARKLAQHPFKLSIRQELLLLAIVFYLVSAPIYIASLVQVNNFFSALSTQQEQAQIATDLTSFFRGWQTNRYNKVIANSALSGLDHVSMAELSNQPKLQAKIFQTTTDSLWLDSDIAGTALVLESRVVHHTPHKLFMLGPQPLAMGATATLTGTQVYAIACEDLTPACFIYTAVPVSLTDGKAAIVTVTSVTQLLASYNAQTGQALTITNQPGQHTISPVILRMPDRFRLSYVPDTRHTSTRRLIALITVLLLASPVVLTAGLLAFLSYLLHPINNLIRELPGLSNGQELSVAKAIMPEPKFFQNEIDLLRIHIHDLALQLHVFRDNETRSITEKLKQAETEQVRASRAQLAAQFVLTIEDERKAMAADLHDEMSQLLVALRFGLNSLARMLPTANPAYAQVTLMQDTLLTTQQSLHATLESLRPGMLDTHGLTTTIAVMLKDWGSRVPSCYCSLTMSGNLDQLPDYVQVTVFRIIQESVTNAMRHANASHVQVNVDASDPAALTVTVTDDGVGFNPDSETPRHGLLGLRERVAAFSGSLRITSAPGKGTTIYAAIPLDQHHVDDLSM